MKLPLFPFHLRPFLGAFHSRIQSIRRLLVVTSVGAFAGLAGDLHSWQLRSTAQVDGSGILLASVMESIPSGLGAVRLGNAPPAGQSVVFTSAQMIDLLQKADPSLSTTNWTGASRIKITRRCRTLADSEVRDLVTAALQKGYAKDRGELELRLTNPWTPVAVPDDLLTVKILDLPTIGITPNFILRFELASGSETVGQWQVPLQARLWRDVWISGAKAQRGAVLKDCELVQERRDLLSLRDPVIHLNPDDTTLELTENLAAGTPLTPRSLRVRSVVFRGHVLDAIVQEGGLVISVKVEALENGAPGQTVRVRNLNSKREFRGKVQNEETILVSL